MAIKIYGGGPNPAVSLDPFRTIVNVHWPASDDGEYICLIYSFSKLVEDLPTSSVACDDPEPILAPYAQQYLSSLQYRVSYGIAYEWDSVARTWGYLLDGFSITDDAPYPGPTISPAAWTIQRSAGQAVENTWSAGPGLRWRPTAGAATGIPIPNVDDYYPADRETDGLTFDETTAPTAYFSADIVTGTPRCTISAGVAATRAETTGITPAFDSGGKSIRHEPTHEHGDTPYNFSATKLLFADGTEWIAVATKVVGQVQQPESASRSSESTELFPGDLHVLFRKVVPPEPTP